jgi:hypothetical protein
MRKHSDMYVSELHCTVCGAVFPIHRKKHARREKCHIKDLWCWRCGEITKFKENDDEERYSEGNEQIASED